MSEEELEEKWFEIVGFFDSDSGEVVDYEGDEIYVRGEINNITVVQVSEVYGNEQATVARLQSAREVMKMMGIESGIVVTDSVKFMRLKKITKEELNNRINVKRNMTIQ